MLGEWRSSTMSSLRVTNRRREAGRPMPGLVTMYADAAVSKKTTVKSIFTTEKYLHFMFSSNILRWQLRRISFCLWGVWSSTHQRESKRRSELRHCFENLKILRWMKFLISNFERGNFRQGTSPQYQYICQLNQFHTNSEAAMLSRQFLNFVWITDLKAFYQQMRVKCFAAWKVQLIFRNIDSKKFYMTHSAAGWVQGATNSVKWSLC